MHAIEEAKGCMQKGKDFNRLQAKGDTIFRGEIIFGEKPFLGRSPFWGEAIFGEKPFWGEAIKKCLKVRQKLGTRENLKI